MSALAGVPHQPIVEYWICVTDDLRRAANNQAGRDLSDEEVARVIHADINSLIERWRAMGQWLGKIDELGAVDQQAVWNAEIQRRRTLFPEHMRRVKPR